MTNSRLIHGFGSNNRKYPTKVDGKPNKEYKQWLSMIRRCYDKKFHTGNPTYIDCSVSDNFLNYSYFHEWCQWQIGFGVDGIHLDKDILIPNNKIYSEDTCVFVPSEINLFFTARGNARGEWPIGVYFNKQEGKFRAQCTVNGKPQHLGYFSTPEEAHAVYKQFKENLCKELANKWRGKIDERVYNAMMFWSV